MSLQETLERFPREETYLIEILSEVQKQRSNHFLTTDEIRAIAQYVQVSEAKVCGVLSFYSLITDKPKGKYVIQICRDIPCHVNKSSDIVSTLEQMLGIRVGETTPNGLFTLEFSSCLGHCDASPCIRVDSRTYVHLTPDKIKAIVAEYRGKI
jgi:NADH:ubiquinone oxidoreductase subunit E